MRRKLKLSNIDATVLKTKIAQYHKNKIKKLLLVDTNMSELGDLYKEFMEKRSEIFSRLKKLEAEISFMNEEEMLFQKELEKEFRYEYLPKTWLTLYPITLKKFLAIGDGTLTEQQFYNSISEMEKYLDLQIKKNQEKLISPQPQLIKKVEI